mgnify:FL=1
MAPAVYVEGKVAKYSKNYIGIYVKKKFQKRLSSIYGRKVRILVLVDDEVEEGSEDAYALGSTQHQ